jgi:hypothetical protein
MSALAYRHPETRQAVPHPDQDVPASASYLSTGHAGRLRFNANAVCTWSQSANAVDADKAKHAKDQWLVRQTSGNH